MSNDNDQTLSQDELASLKARADMLGLKYHPSIGVDALREKVNAKLAETPAATGDTPPQSQASSTPPADTSGEFVAVPPPETADQKRKRRRLEATKLVRIRLTCMNPLKKEWDGEIITAGNAAVGSIKKYVPFNQDEGYHVPHIIYEQLLARQCQTFYTERSKNGVQIRKGKLIREFAIEVLPQLTQEELDELARRQAAAHSIDN